MATATKPQSLGASVPRRKRNQSPSQLANLRPAWKPGETGNPQGHHKAPMVEPIIRHYATLSYADMNRLRANMDDLTLVEIMVLQGYLAAMDQQGDKARDWVTRKLDGPDEKKGDTINIDKAILVRYVEGSP